MNQFVKYAQNYNCSVAQAIADRDWPMNYEQCVKAFKEATGQEPQAADIIQMSPDDERTMREEAELQDWEDFDMGRR